MKKHLEKRYLDEVNLMKNYEYALLDKDKFDAILKDSSPILTDVSLGRFEMWYYQIEYTW